MLFCCQRGASRVVLSIKIQRADISGIGKYHFWSHIFGQKLVTRSYPVAKATGKSSLWLTWSQLQYSCCLVEQLNPMQGEHKYLVSSAWSLPHAYCNSCNRIIPIILSSLIPVKGTMKYKKKDVLNLSAYLEQELSFMYHCVSHAWLRA